MDLGQVGFIGVVVIAAVGALKDYFGDKLTGNMTRLVAIVIGGVIGLIAQLGYLPGISATFVTGALAGVAAIATVTVVDRVRA